MKWIYISTIFRLTAVGLEGGELGRVYALDFDTKELLTKPVGLEPGYSLHKPLGSSHGARGICILGDFIYVAGSGSRISKFDLTTFELKDSFEYGEFMALHQIRAKDGKLYVASPGNDTEYILLDDKIVDRRYLKDTFANLEPYIEEKWASKRAWGKDFLHFNSIAWDSLGDEYHVYFSPSALVNFSKGKIIYMGSPLVKPHDIVFHCGDAIVNSSVTHETVRIDMSTGNADIIYKVKERKNDKMSENNDFGFTRGLAKYNDFLFVGSVPGDITVLRRKNNGDYLVEDMFRFSDVIHEAIYDMVLDPRDWV